MRTGSASYVAGYEEVPNPSYQKVRANIATMARQLDQTNRMLASLEGERTLYEFEITSLNEALPSLEERVHQLRDQSANVSVAVSKEQDALRTIDEALAALDERVARWNALTTEIDGVLQQLSALGDDATVEERQRLEQTLVSLQTEKQALTGLTQERVMLTNDREQMARQLALVREEYQKVSKDLMDVEQEFTKSQARLATCMDEFGAVRQELNDMVLEFSGINKEYNQLLAEFLSLSPTITREIQELYHYQIRDWTRTCAVTADMTLVTPPQPDMKQLLEIETQTQDSAHPAHRRHGVPADTLTYPKSDIELVNTADALLQNMMKDWLKQALSGVRATRLARAQRRDGNDNEGAAADYLVKWMLSSRQPPAGLESFIEQTYGKMDLDWLEVRGH